MSITELWMWRGLFDVDIIRGMQNFKINKNGTHDKPVVTKHKKVLPGTVYFLERVATTGDFIARRRITITYIGAVA